MNMKTGNREKTIYKVTWVGFFANLVLSIAKLLAGIFGRSGAMIADAVHSIS
ncbi:MAG TPA: cation transporter, partial [Paludibacteraceae bacterium]|nr:cation transporter [Paludibacteraceae bacterium]